MNKKTHDFWYMNLIVKQGGEYCILCNKDKSQLMQDGQTPRLCIDHINNNNSINEIDNLQFLCHSCNTKKNHPKTTEPFERTQTPEMVLGKRYEKDFRRWVLGQFQENENIGLEYSFLVNSGAEKVGCSTETIKRYLNKMTSKEGLYEWNDRFGSVLLILKDEFKI